MLHFRTKQKSVFFSVAFLCAALSWMNTSTLFAQTSTGRILGTVTDSTGGAISGAEVTVTDTDRGTTRRLVTDAAGEYNAPSLIPGNYSVKAESKGFNSTERNGITLEVNGQLQIDVVLHPGEQTQTVTITAEAPLIETTNATLGGTIENKVINDLPLNGRNFANLLDLRPGTSRAPGGSNYNYSSDGGRPHADLYLIEGVYSNDPWNSKSMMNATMAAGDAGTILPIEAIDEFKTQQNPQAEFGWKSGSVTVVGLKSGTNAYHGTAYAYGRDGAWDAQNFFASGQPKADLGVEQFGASLGAPIIKDKLFYFVNFEQQMYDVSVQAQHTVPIVAPGVGTSANNLIAACQTAAASSTGLAAVSAQIAGLSSTCVPLSNYPGLFPNNTGTSTLFNTNLPNTNAIYSGIGKVDYRLNDKNMISGSYFRSQGAGTFVDNPAIEVNPNRELNQSAIAQFGSALWTWTPSSSWVNAAHVGYSQYKQTFFSVDATQNPADYYGTYHLYTGTTNPLSYGFPLITINPFGASLSGAAFPNVQGPDNVLYISDNVSYQWGRHSIMFGGQVQANDVTSFVPGQAKGTLTFGSLVNFFEGTLSKARTNQGNYNREYTNQGYSGFIQDEWHVRSGLTVTLGLRYEYYTTPGEANNLLGNFIPGQGLVQVGNQISKIFNPTNTNFAPRAGIAWSLDSKTVLRVGGGIMYDGGSYDSLMSFSNQYGLSSIPTGVPLYFNGNSAGTTAGGTINAAAFTYSGASVNPISVNWRNNGPNTPLFPSFTACGDGSTKTAAGVTPGQCSIFAVNPNLKTPYVTSWTVDIQRALSNSLSLDLGYIGNHGTRLWGVTDLNQPTFGAGWTPAILAACETAPSASTCAPSSAAETAARPYNTLFPYLKNIEYLSNSDWSNYDGLQAVLTQRSWKGLSYVAGYTWSHAMGLSSDAWRFILPINSNNTSQLYGNTLFDIRQRFTYSATYALPGVKSPGQMLQGWSVNAILHLQSGMPWGVNDATTDFSGTGESGNTSNTTGEKWNFYGNYSDFNWSKTLLNTNGGAGGIPYFSGTSNAGCLSRAQALGPAAVASLSVLGCYANGSSVMIPAAYGSYGSMAPNTFTGPGFANLDFSVSKLWSVRESVRFQFRAEIFNIFNHPNFANPNGTPWINQTSPATDPSAAAGSAFGILRSTPDVAAGNPVLGSGGPRAVQLGLKILF